ncbi:AAA family ATPase [Vibrio astriarenae]
MSLIVQTFSELKDSDNSTIPHTLKGLEAGKVGMIVAPPEVGKSHICLCIAIEFASSLNDLGFSASATPSKVLYLSTEDSASAIKTRMEQKLDELSESISNDVVANMHFSNTNEPIVTINSMVDCRHFDDLVDTFSKYSLVIIDTLSESLSGELDEVTHDKLIRTFYRDLAAKSGASILLVHHVNKAETSGEKEITVASGAGATSLMRLCKFLFAVVPPQKKKDDLRIKFLKSNYLPQDFPRNFPISWRGNMLISEVDLEVGSIETVKNLPARKEVRSRSKRLVPKPQTFKASLEASDIERKVRNRDLL